MDSETDLAVRYPNNKHVHRLMAMSLHMAGCKLCFLDTVPAPTPTHLCALTENNESHTIIDNRTYTHHQTHLRTNRLIHMHE